MTHFNFKDIFRRSMTVGFAALLAVALVIRMPAPLVRADDTSSTPQAPADTTTSATSSNDASASNDASGSANTGGNTTDVSPSTGDAQTPPSGGPDASSTGGQVTSNTTSTTSDTTSTSPDTSSTSVGDATLNTTTTDASSTSPSSSSTDSSATSTSSDTSSTPADTSSSNTTGSGGADTGAIITTGNAAAAANVVNVVNTNIFDSTGFLSLLNLFDPQIGDVSTDGLSFPLSGCTSDGCSLGNLSVDSQNSGTVTNDVTVGATTGGNTASGTSTITTGDAAAAANVVNVVNSNFVDSNYLLMVVNNFSQWIGDLVFPGKSFFTGLTDGSALPDNSGTGGSTTISNANDATVVNNTETTAATGGNTVDASGTATVTTGDAAAVTNTANLVNTNLVNSDQVYIVVRVFGNWAGNIFSTPPGLTWEQTPYGLVLHNSDSSPLFTTDASSSSCCDLPGSTSNTNTADVQNNVKVYALTGGNQVSGGGGSITTGNAGAVSNVINLVNTNVVGRNVLLAFVNIFGDWQGNLAFGKPDLWTGIRAELSSNPLTENTEVTYHVTIANRGTADATDVAVQSGHSVTGLMNVSDAGGGTPSGDGVGWTIPVIPAGASTTLTFSERTSDNLPIGLTPLVTTVTATPKEDDADSTDNTDAVSLPLERTIPLPIASHLSLKETNSATAPIGPDSDVKFHFTVRNNGAVPATSVLLHEKFYDPWGTLLGENTWTLGSIDPGHGYAVDYDTHFDATARTGYYTSFSSLEGADAVGTIQSQSDMISGSSVYLVNPADATPPPSAPPTVHFVAPQTPNLPNAVQQVSPKVQHLVIQKLLSRRTPPVPIGGLTVLAAGGTPPPKSFQDALPAPHGIFTDSTLPTGSILLASLQPVLPTDLWGHFTDFVHSILQP